MIHVSHVICHTLTLLPRGYYKPPIPSKTPTPTPQYPSPLQCARVMEGKGGGRKCLPWGYPCHSLAMHLSLIGTVQRPWGEVPSLPYKSCQQPLVSPGGEALA